MSPSLWYREKLLTMLYSLYQEQQYCDLTLKVKDGEIKVHQLILIASSDYFNTLLRNDSQSGSVHLPDLTVTEVEMVLKYVYTGELNPPQDDVSVMNLLKMYGLTEKAIPVDKDWSDMEIKMFGSNSQKQVTEDIDLNDSSKSAPLTNQSRNVSDCYHTRTSNRRSDSPDKLCKTVVHCLEQPLPEQDISLDVHDHTVPDLSDQLKIAVSSSTGDILSRSNRDSCDSLGGCGKPTRKQSPRENVSMTCTNSLYVPVDQEQSRADDRQKGRDIVHEAYLTAMELTDADGGTSTKNHQEEEEGSNHGNNLVSRSADARDRNFSSSRKLASLNENTGDHLVSECEYQDKVFQPVVSRTDDKNTDSSQTPGVVGGLRSRSGKRQRKVYTDDPYLENGGSSSGAEHSSVKLCRTKQSKRELKDCESVSAECRDKEAVTRVKKGRHLWYTCPECNRTFKSLKLVAGHRHSKHEVAFDPSEFQVLKCKDCDYETLEVHRLACHQSTSHSTTRPYVCEWCGKDFKLLGALTLHTNSHTKAKKFECPHCDKTFTQHGARKRHIEEKHKKSHRHLCDLCPFSVLDRVKLVQHKYTQHSIPLPSGYTICSEPDCKFETFRKQLFTGHINTHKGIQEYSCDVCQKKFASAGNMRSHRTVHKDKSLSCTYPGCDFTTRLNNRLAQHVRIMHTHRDMKPHVCPHCPYKTAIKGNLIKHQRNIHGANLNNANTNVQNYKGDNSIEGDNSVNRDNSIIQIPLENSTGVLKSLLYSSGSLQFVDVAKQNLSNIQEITVNGTSPDMIFDGVTQMVLDIVQSN